MIDPGLMDMIMRLRGRGISDANVLRAMEQAPRRHFIPDSLRDKANEDRALPIDCGQTVSDPLTVAMMTMALNAQGAHKLLEIGTGSGWHAAVLSRMVTRVYTVERYHALSEAADLRFRRLGLNNIVTRHGDGRYGWKGQAPFDRIIITGGVKKVPPGLLEQLANGGTLVAVAGDTLQRITKPDGMIKAENILPMTLPPLENGKSKAL